jgi:hypothetical protein
MDSPVHSSSSSKKLRRLEPSEILFLYDDLVPQVFHYLPQHDLGWLFALSSTCKTWYTSTQNPKFWLSVLLHLGFSVERLSEFLDVQSLEALSSFLKSSYSWSRTPSCLSPELVTLPNPPTLPPPIEILNNMVMTIKIHGEVTYGSWPDCEGSTGTSYYSLHERGEALAREDFHQLRAVLNLGLISPSIPLVSQIRPILRLFGAGNYSVKILHKVIFHGFHRPNP